MTCRNSSLVVRFARRRARASRGDAAESKLADRARRRAASGIYSVRTVD